MKLTELISLQISSIKHSGDHRLSPDVPLSRTFPQVTYIRYSPDEARDFCHLIPRFRVSVKGNIPRISSYTWLFAKNTGWFVVLRSNP